MRDGDVEAIHKALHDIVDALAGVTRVCEHIEATVDAISDFLMPDDDEDGLEPEGAA